MNMADPKLLCEIPLYRMGNSNNWVSIPVMAINDYSFQILTSRKRLTFQDEELKLDAEGKIIIDLEPLDLQFFDKNNKMPTEFKRPLDVMEI